MQFPLTSPVVEAIHHRQSVRSFSPRPIPQPTLTAIIEAGNMASSGQNRQPWRFVVVENQNLKQWLLEITLPLDQEILKGLEVTAPQHDAAMRKAAQETPKDPMYFSTPVSLCVNGTGAGTERRDCPPVYHNAMLAAHSVGVGTCRVGAGRRGLLDDPEVVEAFKLAEGETIDPPIVRG